MSIFGRKIVDIGLKTVNSSQWEQFRKVIGKEMRLTLLPSEEACFKKIKDGIMTEGYHLPFVPTWAFEACEGFLSDERLSRCPLYHIAVLRHLQESFFIVEHKEESDYLIHILAVWNVENYQPEKSIMGL